MSLPSLISRMLCRNFFMNSSRVVLIGILMSPILPRSLSFIRRNFSAPSFVHIYVPVILRINCTLQLWCSESPFFVRASGSEKGWCKIIRDCKVNSERVEPRRSAEAEAKALSVFIGDIVPVEDVSVYDSSVLNCIHRSSRLNKIRHGLWITVFNDNGKTTVADSGTTRDLYRIVFSAIKPRGFKAFDTVSFHD